MFDALNQLFSSQPASDRAEQAHRLHLATAVLMIEIGRADFHIHEAELEAVADALQQRFRLSSAELADLLELAHQQSGISTPSRKRRSWKTCGGSPLRTGGWISTRNTISDASPTCCTCPTRPSSEPSTEPKQREIEGLEQKHGIRSDL